MKVITQAHALKVNLKVKTPYVSFDSSFGLPRHLEGHVK